MSDAELTWEYTLVYDGVPFMDGTHERCRIGTFHAREEAYRAYAIVIARSDRAPKPNLHLERRLVAAWEVVNDEA